MLECTELAHNTLIHDEGRIHQTCDTEINYNRVSAFTAV
jgi:hypothetical protein